MSRRWWVALLLVAGCKSGGTDALKELEQSVEAYNHAYRWKNYERAAAYLPSDLRPAFIAAYEDDEKSLHIEDYRVLAVNLESEEAAIVSVRISYTLLPDITVQKRTLTQHWHKVAGQWILENEDGALRELDPSAFPKNPRAVGEEEAEKDPKTDVEVTAPDGTTLRKDGDGVSEPSPEAPDEPE